MERALWLEAAWAPCCDRFAVETLVAMVPSLAAWQVLVFYGVAIVFATWLGGMAPDLLRLTHTRMQSILSFVGGLMLGIAVFHLLPHSLAELGPQRIDLVAIGIMFGMLLMFFLLRAFHFHQHGPGSPLPSGVDEHGEAILHADDGCGSASGHRHHHSPQHSQAPSDHGGELSPSQAVGHARGVSAGGSTFRWLGVMIGLGVHTLLDGMAVAAAVLAESAHGEVLGFAGLAVFLAVFLHKPLDAISITWLMQSGGWSKAWRRSVAIALGMMAPLGMGLLAIGLLSPGLEGPHLLIGLVLAVSTGIFLCISLSDLLPEMEFHSHNRVQLSVSLLSGVLVAYALGWLEPEHAHHHHAAGDSQSSGHFQEKWRDAHDPHQGHDHSHQLNRFRRPN